MKVALITTDKREAFKRYHEPEPSFGSAIEAMMPALAEQADLELHVICCYQKPVRSPAKLFPRVSFHALHVPASGWLRSLYQGCVRAIRRELDVIRPDLVHGNGTERECGLAAALSRRPNLVTVRGNMRSIARRYRARPLSYLWLSARLEQFALARTDGVLCISSYTRDMVAPIARHTWMATNAVNERFFNISPTPADEPLLLCPATICPHKNQHALIAALDTLQSELPLRMVFAGDANPAQPYARDVLQQIEARPWCSYAGALTGPDVIRSLAVATLVVLPSLEDNCPNVVLEAMAAGIPVAAARIGGIPDLVRLGETGTLFDPSDPADIARCLRGLLENRAMAAGMAHRARKEARERFSPKAVAARHMEIYRDLLQLARRATSA